LLSIVSKLGTILIIFIDEHVLNFMPLLSNKRNLQAAVVKQSHNCVCLLSLRMVWCHRYYGPTQLNWTRPQNVQNIKKN
jgi:hypothetical protein